MPSATTSWHHSLARPSDERRSPVAGAFDSISRGSHPDAEQTWAAGDKRTQALGLALKRQLSAPDEAKKARGTGEEDGSAPGSDAVKTMGAGGGDDSGRGRTEYEQEVMTSYALAEIFAR